MTAVDLTHVPNHVLPIYGELLNDRSRFLVLWGGAGSGKSVFCAQKVLMRCMAREGHRMLALRKVARTCRLSVFQLLLDVIEAFGVREHWRINKSELSLTFVPNGSVIHAMGMDDPEKIKSIQGISSAWFEEVTEFNQADVEQVMLRMRGATPGYKQALLSFNPVSQMNWVKARFFDNPPGGVRYCHTTYRDNPKLDDEYIRVLLDLAEQNASLGRVYIDGQWGVMKGLIYEPPDTTAPWPDHFDFIVYGLDFGYQNPTALVRASVLDRTPWLECPIYETKLTTRQVSDRMAALGIAKGVEIIADSAEPDRIAELNALGWNVKAANKGPGSVVAGIDLCQSLDLHVRPSEVELLREFESYVWKEINGRPTDQPVDMFNHAMDAMRYALMAKLGRQRTGRPINPSFGGQRTFAGRGAGAW